MSLLQKSTLTILGLVLLAGCGGTATTQNGEKSSIKPHQLDKLTRTGEKSGVELNVKISNNKTHYLFDYNSSTEHIQIYLDTDKNEASGYRPWGDEGLGAEYLIEDNNIFKYNAQDGQDWSWEYLGQIGDGNHIALALNYFGVDVNSFVALSVAVDSNWEDAFSTDNEVVSRILNIKYPQMIREDYAWSEDNLNFYFITRKKTAHKQHYIDTDFDENTGYRYDDSMPIGAEYIVEDNILYKYNSSKEGSDWPFDFVRKLATGVFEDNKMDYVIIPKKEIPQWDGLSHIGTAFFDEDWNIDTVPRQVVFTRRAHNAKYINTEIKTTTKAGYETVTHLEYDKRGNLTKKSYDSRNDGSIEWENIHSYKYNENGQILEKSTVEKRDGHDYQIKTTYKYNNRGWILEKYKDIGINTWSKENYRYDANGNVIEKISEGDIDDYYHNIITYSYDANGNLISSTRKDLLEQEGGVVENFKYDDNGNLIEKKSIYSPSYSTLVTYSYDKNGNLIKKVSEDNGRTHVSTYSYDYYGNMLTYKRDGKIITEYSYDDNENMIKRVVYVDDGRQAYPYFYSWEKL